MNIQDIKNNKELSNKLSGIHKSLKNAMEDDYDLDKFSYLERELNIMHDPIAINQRSAFNRMKKVKALMELSDNWDSFQTLYKDDIILKKIGVEFLEGKLDFNKEILDAIKQYPSKNEVQYYFKKGQQVDLGNAQPEDYIRIREQILPAIENEAQIHLAQKNSLIKNVKKIMKDKSLINSKDSNSMHPVKLAENSELKIEYGQEMLKMLEQIKKGNFVAQQDSNIMLVELPIAAIKREDSKPTSSSTILLRMNIDNHRDYSIEVGSLQKLNENFQDKLDAIRQKAFGKPPSNNPSNSFGPSH